MSYAANPLPPGLLVATARLPETYEAATQALARCERIDECQEWANKAEALATYARMADDQSLRIMADRIQARAVRRCGDLLKQINGRGNNQYSEDGEGTLHTQEQAAKDAGLSEWQTKTAVRVANVPADQFEKAVESEEPPTVTQLAEIGKQTRPTPPPAPPGFKEATEALGTVYCFAAFCREHEPEFIAGGITPPEIDDARAQIETIGAWLVRLTEAMQ